ncbi:MAG TPA: hypothetical protein VGO56_02695 [Pyrinomonadaceae bacterium]|jgi:hypothetical protein|nr:hypothetical protein [Pyrinomonadaceae bacterium]
MSKIAFLCAFMLLGPLDHEAARGWRGLVPLRSTCADVKRILGVARCENVIKMERETINISYSEKLCVDGWNVPKGTVIDIQVISKRMSALTDLNLDLNKYQKVAVVVPYDQHDQPGASYYRNAEEGVELEVWDGKLESITYFPTARDSHLRYPNSLADQIGATTSNNSGSFTKFDEYGPLSVKAEKQRLANLALQLRSDTNQNGYIIAYDGRRTRVGEAKTRAERAREYLIGALSIERGRIMIIKGGFREKLAIELFVGPRGHGTPSPFPTVCPTEVQIIKGKR